MSGPPRAPRSLSRRMFLGGGGRVTDASQWPARAAELSDLIQYYLYGYKQPTPQGGSVFRQIQIPATTIVNFAAVFDFTTFTINLPAGSYTIDFSTFVISPVLSFVATQPYTAPAGYQSWAVGDTWATPAHASLLTVVPAPAFAAPPADGFSSPQGETPTWNSQDLQNTPYSGNFHGRWPLYPNSVGDTGRPVSIPAQTAFGATITVTDASATGLTLRFSQPLNPREFGVGLDAVSTWTTHWAADGTSVLIAYGSPVAPGQDVTIIVFRAVDAAGNMIGGPVRLTVTGGKQRLTVTGEQ